jgi:hypothetical protein
MTAVAGASAEILPTHPKEPDAIIFESGDIGGHAAFAKARVTEDSAKDWCENWQAGDDACVADVMKAEDGKIYEAKADCYSGDLTFIRDDRYTYDGLWQNTPDGMWDGWQKFKDDKGKAVGTANAAGGLTLAAQWRTLCPYGAPLDKQPLKMVLGPDDHSWRGETVGHNGSGIFIDADNGTMSYAVVDDRVAGLVKEGTLLFRGSIIYGGPVEGMAFTYKKGCDPAPYKVEGYFQGNSDKLVLTGKAPVREGCKVTGYTEKSPNAKLVFDLPHH